MLHILRQLYKSKYKTAMLLFHDWHTLFLTLIDSRFKKTY